MCIRDRVTDVSLDVPGANGGNTKELERQIDLLAQDASPFVKGHRYYSPVTYFWPDYYNGATSKWNRTLGYGSSLGVVIMNRNSGDWEAFDADFQKQAARALSAGAKRCVFYVKTQYLSLIHIFTRISTAIFSTRITMFER